MMKQFWDQRYSVPSYVYGTQPNNFFKSIIDKLEPGKILLPGEGEGRNAVYAAKLGWNVHAFDYSEVARKKALELARNNKVEIHYWISNIEGMDIRESYDLVGLFFVHLPTEKRSIFNQKLAGALKPGGYLVMEAFNKRQLSYNTGGPKNLAMLYDMSDVRKDFNGLKALQLENVVTCLEEGDHHNGQAETIRFLGKKT